MFDRPDLILARLKAPLLLAAAMFGLWLLLQAGLYRSGLYYRLAEPDSNTGASVNALLKMERGYDAEKRNVLVFGDSRIGEGFSAPLATQQAGSDINFINLSVPGSTARTWYFLLRRIVEQGYRIDAVLVGALYQPRDTMRLADWPLDPAHQIALLRLQDAGDYDHSFESESMRDRARRALWLPALAMQLDTRAALETPLQRLRALRKSRPGFLAAVDAYPGREERMPRLSSIADDGQVQDWGETPAPQRAVVEDHVRDLRLPGDEGIERSNRAFTARWIGAMAELAQAHEAQLIVFGLPRGPYPSLLRAHAASDAVPAALQGHANAQALPASLFDELEDPDFFFDGLHLNRAGRERMSAVLGERVPALLDAGAR